MSKLQSAPWLHMHGQFSYHGEASIVGSRDGLAALREAIDTALSDGEGEASVFATDGEGYHVIVRRSQTLHDMGDPPYLDEIARQIAGVEREITAKMDKCNRSLLDKIRVEKAELDALRSRLSAAGEGASNG